MRRVRDGAPARTGTPRCRGGGMEHRQAGSGLRAGAPSPTGLGPRGPRLIPGMLPQRSGVRGRLEQVCVPRGSSPAANRMFRASLVLGGCLPSSSRERTLFTKVFYPPRRNFALHKLLSCRCCPSPALCQALPRFKIPPEHPHKDLARDHRIMAWFGLEGTSKLTTSQRPRHGQGRLPPDQEMLRLLVVQQPGNLLDTRC
ncbi:uncharacterized protein LOC119695240 isoform X2 [Motacilla alba alba]|uniref:uncharacterized protein LOC119695240 isoform X2 n=1 Tax=Motacilla alba alba TaxID=1094192 RepID=UPI0018D4F950|nr:uncharacterized protein LOC119695240 isoform X2 [Motacilla alba alba]